MRQMPADSQQNNPNLGVRDAAEIPESPLAALRSLCAPRCTVRSHTTTHASVLFGLLHVLCESIIRKKRQLGLKYAALNTGRKWFACEYEPKNDPKMHFLNAR